jgi:hypothetical protein
MADTSFPNSVESPGLYYSQDFSLKSLNFLTANGEKIELKRVMTEFSYYEDIYSFCASGYITITDAQGFIELLQLTGNEFIEINFGKMKNGKNETGKQFRVYKAGNRRPSGNMNSEFYTLYFCSEELVLSEQRKISKSFKGTEIYRVVDNILKEELRVKTDKIEKIEETKGVYDFIIPRLKPFEAISWLSNYARPKDYVGADMLFFETKNGYNFRSLQSMFSDNVYATYKYQAKNISYDLQNPQEKATTILKYEIVKPYDILSQINSGAMANRLISIDPLTRTYKTTNFNYDKFKGQAKTLNSNKPSNDLKNRFNKSQSEEYDGVLKVSVGNADQKMVPYIKEAESGVAQDVFVETYIPSRTAQIALANYTIIRASIPGDPGITAGRTINFNVYTLKPTNDKKDLDKFYSGKYLVTAVRHIILPQGLYQTILELAKDSSGKGYQNIKDNNSQKSAIKA